MEDFIIWAILFALFLFIYGLIKGNLIAYGILVAIVLICFLVHRSKKKAAVKKALKMLLPMP